MSDIQGSLFSATEIPQKRQQPNEQEIQMLVRHYRETGFPYPTFSLDEKKERLAALHAFDHSSLIINEAIINYDGEGTKLANSFFPHRYNVPCGNQRTPMQTFQHQLEKVVRKCFLLGDGANPTRLLSMLCIFSGTQVSANFSPAVAAAIYDHLLYGLDEAVVWDMSCGYGGRLLGASAARLVTKYIGTDPSTQTFAGLQQIVSELTLSVQTELHNCGSEEFTPSEKVDLCFTSPPYYNTERYAEEETQSFIRYSAPDEWRRNFLFRTFENCASALRSEGIMAINIANVNTMPHLEDHTCALARKAGLVLERTMRLSLPMMPGRGKGRRQQGVINSQVKSEPLFIFRKKA